MNSHQKHSLRLSFFLLLYTLSCPPLLANQNSLTTPLFQNLFFPLSIDSSLICTTDETGFLTVPELIKTINFYEKNNPAELRKHAVAVLADHSDPDHVEDLQEYKKDCEESAEKNLCILENYWDSEEAALRALSLFYDTKTIIKHGENYKVRRFTKDHLRVFEKAIRKIPSFMRKNISKAKPIRDLDKATENIDAMMRHLIKEAFPDDFATSIWSDDTHPLTFVPGVGFRSLVVAQVYNGQNLIIFTVKGLDKAKDGSIYRNIDLRYLVDFRIPIIVHEIAHTIDNFHFWNGNDELYYFYRYRKMSTDNQTTQLILKAKLALWPSKWFEAFEYLAAVNDGRYDGQTQEKLAELVAQYILIPERLKQSAPTAYAWLRDDVFKKIEYSGYDSCPTPVVKSLNWWEYSISKVLGL